MAKLVLVFDVRQKNQIAWELVSGHVEAEGTTIAPVILSHQLLSIGDLQEHYVRSMCDLESIGIFLKRESLHQGKR